MASSFGRYTGGIEASTGNLVQASGQMAAQTVAVGLNFGQNLAQGLQQYNENSQKSEAANAKIQMLGQEVADKIAMYSKDPEIAQSGILDGLIQTGKMLSEAPTKGFAQRAQIAIGAEAKLSGFGGQLQEMMFLRGREMERVTQEGLNKFNGIKSVTDPAFAKAGEFAFDPNKTLEENKADALAKLNAIRKSNPKMEGNDDDFLSSWLSNSEQAMAKADPASIPAAVSSSVLEQIAAEKNNLKRNALVAKANKEGRGLTMEEVMSAWSKGEDVISDYEKTRYHAGVDALPLPEIDAKKQERLELAKSKANKTKEQIVEIDKKIKVLDESIESGEAKARSPIIGALTKIEAFTRDTADIGIEQSLRNMIAMRKRLSGEKEVVISKDFLTYNYNVLSGNNEANDKLFDTSKINAFKKFGESLMKFPPYNIGTQALVGFAANSPYTGFARGTVAFTENEDRMISNFIKDKQQERKESDTFKLGTLNIPVKKTATEQKEGLLATKLRLQAELKTGEFVDPETGKKLSLKNEPKRPTVAPVALNEMVVGSVTKEQKLSVMERQKEVADFITSRMGAIDPTDPERKRRLPVSGFDKFYKSLVPESEIREFTTDSGVRMLYANGKWEQIKGAEGMTLQDIRKGQIGVYGQQDASGRLVPTEFSEGSGVYIGGLFKGTDAANDKYSEEISNLIDARRGVRKLTEINDRVGEFFSPSAQGEAEVEVMNLSAMLRTDIIGVGTVSNYEQELIKNVIRNPTNFFNLESKDRAILLALAQRVDRRIKSHSAARGLTVIIKDDTGSNKYQALREQYLREKGIL